MALTHLSGREIDAFPAHREKCQRVAAEMAEAAAQGVPVRLRKPASNLFRRRDPHRARWIDMRRLDQVLRIDPEQMTADVEGATTYEAFVDATLPYGLLPAVVPQLKTITVGGAVSGLGIESSSFRFGLVHESVEELEILLSDGRIVVCSRRENQDLFFGFPNSYGTLGYLLRLKVRLISAQPFVHLTHTRYADPRSYFARIAQLCGERTVDYLDGTIFSRDEMYVTAGRFTANAPRPSDYTYMGIYYKSIPKKKEDWLTAKDYIWRWDTDWFWCSRHFQVQRPLVRCLAGRRWLNSRTYQKLMRLSQRLLPVSGGTESVIQDVDIPIGNALEFFDFLHREIGITPVWVCPFQNCDPTATYDLYALDPRKLYLNFGFWDVLPSNHEEGYYNRKIERKARELEGKKGLYSTSYYDAETFWQIYNRQRYDELKTRYDANRVLPDLYEKCVGRR